MKKLNLYFGESKADLKSIKFNEEGTYIVDYLGLLNEFRKEMKCDFATTQGLDRFACWLEIKLNEPKMLKNKLPPLGEKV